MRYEGWRVVMGSDHTDYLRLQGQMCGRLGSPFYEALLTRAADDAAAAGPIAAAFEGYPLAPIASAMALRLMGAVHRLVLDGEAPTLAPFYPSVGGDDDGARAWPAFRDFVAAHLDRMRALLTRPVQTNEVGRTAALVCGFLEVARTQTPALRCLEIGASAGLNLRWDHFRYEAPAAAWGDPASPVVLRGCYRDDSVPFDVAATVVERAGCDPNPLDPTTDDGRKTLLSYVWPDQAERLALVRAACDVAGRVPVAIDRANGADWVAERLAARVPGIATVVYHSIVIQYLDDASRDRLLATIADAGRHASARSPLAWLRMEPGGEQAEVWLTTWPGGEERLIATAGFHGRDVACRLARTPRLP
jgi:hypothetical protein